MNDEGHSELQEAVHEAWDAHQQGSSNLHEVHFRENVLQALKNLTWRVHRLEQDLEAAEETIAKLEGR